MKLVIFQGNPGLKYRKTRHNVGFMVGDFYAQSRGAKFKLDKKFNAEIAEINVDGEKVILAKPQTFYNLTGQVTQKIMSFYKLVNSDILVVCDDLNLDFGCVRYREQGSDGGNNGLKSIIQHIGSDFARIRIGIDNDLRAQIGDTDFVLSKLSREEQAALKQLLPEIAKRIDEMSF